MEHGPDEQSDEPKCSLVSSVIAAFLSRTGLSCALCGLFDRPIRDRLNKFFSPLDTLKHPENNIAALIVNVFVEIPL
jgi:hypothetical protein